MRPICEAVGGRAPRTLTIKSVRLICEAVGGRSVRQIALSNV